MGRALTRLLKKLNYEVYICSRSESKARRAAKTLKAEAGRFESLPNMDIVIVSVPVEATIDVCVEAIQLMKERSLLVDIAAVKNPIVEAVSKHLPEGGDLEYLSLHPLFGPTTRSYRGENLIAVKAKPGPITERFLRDLMGEGLNVTVTSPREHDKAMAAYQVLHHYSFISLAVALEEYLRSEGLALDPKFYTKSFRSTLKILKRMQGNLESILEIQSLNPEARDARQTMIDSILELQEIDGVKEKIRGAFQQIKTEVKER